MIKVHKYCTIKDDETLADFSSCAEIKLKEYVSPEICNIAPESEYWIIQFFNVVRNLAMFNYYRIYARNADFRDFILRTPFWDTVYVKWNNEALCWIEWQVRKNHFRIIVFVTIPLYWTHGSAIILSQNLLQPINWASDAGVPAFIESSFILVIFLLFCPNQLSHFRVRSFSPP